MGTCVEFVEWSRLAPFDGVVLWRWNGITNCLPPEMTQSLVQDTHRRSKSNNDGKNSQAYPALARVASGLFGVCIVGTSGRICCAGDVDYEFSIMNRSKPFLF